MSDETKPEPIWCGCGDGIMPDTGAQCGTCAFIASLPNPLRWPSTPEQIRDFIGSNFISRKDEKPAPEGTPIWAGEATENDVYTLSAHDLLSAFSEWAEAQADAASKEGA